MGRHKACPYERVSIFNEKIVLIICFVNDIFILN